MPIEIFDVLFQKIKTSAAQLTASDTTAVLDGVLAIVTPTDTAYILDKGSVLPVDGVNVLTATPAGRWIAIGKPNSANELVDSENLTAPLQGVYYYGGATGITVKMPSVSAGGSIGVGDKAFFINTNIATETAGTIVIRNHSNTTTLATLGAHEKAIFILRDNSTADGVYEIMLFKSMSAQSANDVNITGGTLDGVAITDSTIDNSAITGGTMTSPAITTPTVTGGSFSAPNLTNPVSTGGTFTTATLTSPTATNITSTGGTFTDPTLVNPNLDLDGATINNLTVTNITVTDGTLTDVVIASSDLNNSSISNPTIEGGTADGMGVANAAITNSTLSGPSSTVVNANTRNLKQIAVNSADATLGYATVVYFSGVSAGIPITKKITDVNAQIPKGIVTEPSVAINASFNLLQRGVLLVQLLGSVSVGATVYVDNSGMPTINDTGVPIGTVLQFDSPDFWYIYFDMPQSTKQNIPLPQTLRVKNGSVSNIANGDVVRGVGYDITLNIPSVAKFDSTFGFYALGVNNTGATIAPDGVFDLMLEGEVLHTFSAGSPAVGDPLYLTDTGDLSLTATSVICGFVMSGELDPNQYKVWFSWKNHYFRQVAVNTFEPKADFHSVGSNLIGLDGEIADADMQNKSINTYFDTTSGFRVAKTKNASGIVLEEEISRGSVVVGVSGAIATSIVLNYIKIGSLVQISIPDILGTIASAAPLTISALPAKLRPNVSLEQNVRIRNNNANPDQVGIMQIQAGGNLVAYIGGAGGVFTAGQNGGVYARSWTYDAIQSSS